MRVLLIKMSSMGDVIHALPALSDAAQQYKDIRFDWLVEPAFAAIPAWHPHVDRVISMPLRCWKKSPFRYWRNGEIQQRYKELRRFQYDAVIDLQGLIKSAVVSRVSGCSVIHGFSKATVREPVASYLYTKQHDVPRSWHAMKRLRGLMAAALGYEMPTSAANFSVRLPDPVSSEVYFHQPYMVFVHATTWSTKYWPVKSWQGLIEQVVQQGYRVLLPWGTQKEFEQACLLAKDNDAAEVLPKMGLSAVARLLQRARAVVSVDTGVGHLSSALGVPTVSLYGPTDPALVGTVGENISHCYSDRSCRPCKQKKCAMNKQSPMEALCMQDISLSQVQSWLSDLKLCKKEL